MYKNRKHIKLLIAFKNQIKFIFTIKTVAIQSLFFYIWRMKTKWYFGALIVILALFGVSQENLIIPNQEIVLQFSNAEVSSKEVQFAILNVKKQLETIGVSQVDIREEANGHLVISYYSEVAITSVKDILSIDTFAVDFVSNDNHNQELPSEQAYNIDVFEIAKNSDIGFGSTGKLIFELKQDYDRFSNPNFYGYSPDINSTENNIEILVGYKLNKTIAIAIKNIPHKIPESRAGPLS